MIKQYSTLLLLLLASLSSTQADDPCRYEYAGKGVIDISSLASTDGKAAFPDETPTTGQNYVYSYNPCKPFTEVDPCTDVAACQVSQNQVFRFALAKQDSATWSYDGQEGSNPVIAYVLGDKRVTVDILCSDDTKPVFTAIGETVTNNYQFRIAHKCGCWDGCKGSKPSGGGDSSLTGGAIFIIILVVVIVLYLVVFTVINAAIHHKRGVELIPHREFWVASPGYVKDGFLFIIRRSTGKGVYQAV